MKKAIRYLRFSFQDQSSHSIERQDVITANWAQHNNVQIADTFIDEGYTARNFDRPDVKKLFEFIKKNNRSIDYLVVSELTRFSRETGDAINVVKKIQLTYGIRIVSAGRNAIYDCTDHTSFFMMVLEFSLGHSENIKRQDDVRGGIYAAKAKEGRYIHSVPPFGYSKEGVGKNSRLVLQPLQAAIIRYIFEAYLHSTPVYIIKKRAIEMGLNPKGNSVIHKILQNPVYSGQLLVKPHKDLPGGLFKGIHEPIIDPQDWHKVQARLGGMGKQKIIISDDFPLRGVLLCHCGRPVTGAPSRGRHGNYYNYYKCNVSSAHNNINAKKAHAQFEEALKHMSLPAYLVTAIKQASEQLLEVRMEENKKQHHQKKQDLARTQEYLRSVEEKWIRNQLDWDAYNRWHDDLSRKCFQLSAMIEKLGQDQEQVRLLLKENLASLSDLHHVYFSASTVEKQQFVRMLFDSSLYYQDGVYRTPYLMEVFTHNQVILKEKKLLEIVANKSGGNISPRGAHGGISIEPLQDLLAFIRSIKVA